MNTNDILSLSSMLSKPEPEIKGSGQKSEFNPGSIGSKNVLPPKEIPKGRDPLTAYSMERFSTNHLGRKLIFEIPREVVTIRLFIPVDFQKLFCL